MKSISRLALCTLAVLFPYEIDVEISDRVSIDLAASFAFAKGENSGKGNNNNDNDDDNSGRGNSDEDDRDDDEDDDRGDSDDGDGDRRGSNGADKGRGLLRIEKISGGVRLRYSDGGREVIRNGKYERRNAKGRVVESRRARGSDIAHVRSKVGRVDFLDRADSTQSTARAFEVRRQGRNIDVLYSNGWLERIGAGRYVLTDQFGRAVVKRTATDDDQARLNKYRK